jgi:hypothetical protein
LETHREKIIFVVGPARSGTHLLASSIASSTEEIKYLAEINEFWNRYNNTETDYMLPDMYSKLELDNIKKEFLILSKGSPVILEKTASNCLRLNFLLNLFPHAKFLFITRNDDEVIDSVERKVLGDPRKISKMEKKVSIGSRFSVFFKRLKAIKENNTMTFGYLIKNRNHYFNLIRSILIGTPLKHWGPKFTTDKDILALEPKEYAKRQLECCLEEIELFKSNKADFLHINFEDLVTKSQPVSRQLKVFLEVKDNIEFNIVGSTNEK